MNGSNPSCRWERSSAHRSSPRTNLFAVSCPLLIPLPPNLFQSDHASLQLRRSNSETPSTDARRVKWTGPICSALLVSEPLTTLFRIHFFALLVIPRETIPNDMDIQGHDWLSCTRPLTAPSADCDCQFHNLQHGHSAQGTYIYGGIRVL